MTPSEKKAEEQAIWLQRHWNPMVKMKWNAEIVVEPANKSEGDVHGFRIFPDGQREMFEVK